MASEVGGADSVGAAGSGFFKAASMSDSAGLLADGSVAAVAGFSAGNSGAGRLGAGFASVVTDGAGVGAGAGLGCGFGSAAAGGGCGGGAGEQVRVRVRVWASS